MLRRSRPAIAWTTIARRSRRRCRVRRSCRRTRRGLTGKARDAVFIDVLPQAPRPAGLPASTIWREKPRDDVPGSIWLPDTGYGALAPVMQQYFEHGLEQASGGDRNRMLVFYCLANCWMSWNAAKRAMAIGYTHVAWYPDGTDGWAAERLPLEPRTPLPRPQAAE